MAWYWWLLIVCQIALDVWLLIVTAVAVIAVNDVQSRLKGVESGMFVMARTADEHFKISDTNVQNIAQFLIKIFHLDQARATELKLPTDMKN